MTATETETTVPLLTDAQYRLACGLSRGPRSLLDCEFSDALHLTRSGLAVLDRHTDRLTITEAGRRFLAAGP